MTNPNMVDRTVVNAKYVVSTVRLAGADRMPDIYGGRIFETMVFHSDANGNVTDWIELDCNRYSSIEAARMGHNDMVLNWTNRS